MADFDSFASPSKLSLSLASTKSQEFPIPVSKSFNFSISEFLKPTKDSLLQWVNDLPGPTQREKPLEPVHYHTLKHNLNYDDSDNESSIDDHHHKRARVSSALSRYPVVETRRRKLADSSRGLVRRVSNACQRVVTPSRCQSVSKRPDSFHLRCPTPAPEPTPPPGTPTFMLVERPKMSRYYRDSFTLHYSPTHYELYNKLDIVDDQEIDIELWDTAGDITLAQLSRLTYLAWDAVFLCFSVTSMKSFHNAQAQWVTQIHRYCPGVPFILVGLQMDKRVGAGLWAPLYPNLETRIAATEGVMTANTIGATGYVECSAMTGQGIHGVFEEGVRTVFKQRAAIKKLEKKKAEHFPGLAELLCFK
ncbi:ras family-domain-containing protein [Xylariaceae sp. FL1651]|nr:ras family-domain-containing protein [Xylariaceae sp. FL1651]